MLDQTTTDPAQLAEITTAIVSAYVSHNTIASSDLASLIGNVAQAMAKVGAPAELPAAEEKHEPVVSIRSSIKPDHLVCLICGQQQKMLKRHLFVAHELTPAEYRERFGLNRDYPMTAATYTEQRRAVALRTGLGTIRSAPKKKVAKPARAKTAGANPSPSPGSNGPTA